MDKREISLGKKFCGVSMHELYHYAEIEGEVEDFLDLPNLIKELKERLFKDGREVSPEETWLVPFLKENHFPGEKIYEWFSVEIDREEKHSFPSFLVKLVWRGNVLAMHSPEMKYFVALSKPTYAEAIRDGKFV